MRDRVFVALDVDSLEEAGRLLDQLQDVVMGVKIGTQLFTSAGPAAVELAHKRGHRVFLDLKFHDIPNTVAGAVRSAARLGVFMLNVHAAGGLQMMRAAAESAAHAAREFGVTRPVCLAVTVLTSLDRRALDRELGVPASVEAHVLRLAEAAREAGLDGCVASPHEIRRLRLALGQRFAIVTPGIRSGTATTEDDQKRVAPARAALEAGADYLVIGRPITGARDPKAAAAGIIAELTASS
jgi:orotidine-5'-phosphate decarboxylase